MSGEHTSLEDDPGALPSTQIDWDSVTTELEVPSSDEAIVDDESGCTPKCCDTCTAPDSAYPMLPSRVFDWKDGVEIIESDTDPAPTEPVSSADEADGEGAIDAAHVPAVRDPQRVQVDWFQQSPSDLRAFRRDSGSLRQSQPSRCDRVPYSTMHLQDRIRVATGMTADQDPDPCPACRPFKRLAEARQFADKLINAGLYLPSQIGVFAGDLGKGGAKHWLVHTFAGFAYDHSPRCIAKTCWKQDAWHLYEVFLEDRPCWLYFDLEYSRGTNPGMEPKDVAEAFYQTLDAFFLEVFGVAADPRAIYDLDSSTPEKFSKHVVVKLLQHAVGTAPRGELQTPSTLAFSNNAKAGLLVRRLVDFARGCRDRDPESPAALLFARAAAKAATSSGVSESVEVSVIDACVYSRNRCFRVLFSSKFGKRRPLLPTWTGGTPAEQLLKSLASFVPSGTELFRHTSIPDDFHHNSVDHRSSGLRRKSVSLRSPKPSTILTSPLVRFLETTWDGVRDEFEPGSRGGHAAKARPPWMPDENFLCVTLERNRYCCRKGASHKSNSIYLVVDFVRKVFYQKCHDEADCGRGFRSKEFAIPDNFLAKLASGDITRDSEAFRAAPAPSTPQRRRLTENGSSLGQTPDPLAKRSRCDFGTALAQPDICSERWQIVADQPLLF